jgi:hypothetical protein
MAFSEATIPSYGSSYCFAAAAMDLAAAERNAGAEAVDLTGFCPYCYCFAAAAEATDLVSVDATQNAVKF